MTAFTMNVSIHLNGTRYLVDPDSVKLAEPNRYICRAWKYDVNGNLREVLNLVTMDRLGRKWMEEMHDDRKAQTQEST